SGRWSSRATAPEPPLTGPGVAYNPSKRSGPCGRHDARPVIAQDAELKARVRRDSSANCGVCWGGKKMHTPVHDEPRAERRPAQPGRSSGGSDPARRLSRLVHHCHAGCRHLLVFTAYLLDGGSGAPVGRAASTTLRTGAAAATGRPAQTTLIK